MIGLTLPPLARPLLASLKRKSGHLTRSMSTPRHLALCGDEKCCDSAPAMLTVTISGAADCTSAMNGTFVLSPTTTCKFGYSETIRADVKNCNPLDACYITSTPNDRFWYPLTLFVTAELSAVTSAMEVRVELSWAVYEIRFGECANVLFLPQGQTAVFSRETCRTGTMIQTSSTGQPWAVNPYSCSVSW